MNTIPRKSDPEAVMAIIEEAALSVMSIYNSGSYSVNRKSDSSPVTGADLLSEKIIAEGIGRLTPDVPLVSEESVTDTMAGDILPADYWIADPLDGTREFIKGNGEFCICLARVTGGEVREGYIVAPATGLSWYAIKGQGAFRVIGGKAERLPCREEVAAPMQVLKSRSHSNHLEDKWLSQIASSRAIAEEHQGSAIKFARIAEGSGDLYVKFSTIFKWDVAAGALLVEEAGGAVNSLISRKRLEFGSPGYTVDPFIASGNRVKDIQELVSTLPAIWPLP